MGGHRTETEKEKRQSKKPVTKETNKQTNKETEERMHETRGSVNRLLTFDELDHVNVILVGD